MNTSLIEIEQLLARDGVIAGHTHPHLRGAMEYLARKGVLVRVLPGVYGRPSDARTPAVRMRAVRAWDPDAILTEEAAASLSFWRGVPMTEVACAVRHRRAPQPGFRFSRRSISPELTIERAGLRITVPALTALDLIDAFGGDAIDHALRMRMTSLEELHDVLERTSGRPGNRSRRELVLDSRDEPWSAAERGLHSLLRRNGITDWHANQPVRLAGHTFFLDVRFDGRRLGIEVDGRELHSRPEVFESDRWRQNLLVLHGWLILRFTWRMIEDRPDEVVAQVRAALARDAPRAARDGDKAQGARARGARAQGDWAPRAST